MAMHFFYIRSWLHSLLILFLNSYVVYSWTRVTRGRAFINFLKAIFWKVWILLVINILFFYTTQQLKYRVFLVVLYLRSLIPMEVYLFSSKSIKKCAYVRAQNFALKVIFLFYLQNHIFSLYILKCVWFYLYIYTLHVNLMAKLWKFHQCSINCCY
jgi:hypothetical protein